MNCVKNRQTPFTFSEKRCDFLRTGWRMDLFSVFVFLWHIHKGYVIVISYINSVKRTTRRSLSVKFIQLNIGCYFIKLNNIFVFDVTVKKKITRFFVKGKHLKCINQLNNDTIVYLDWRQLMKVLKKILLGHLR